jgi:hypothetical protein
MDFNYHEFKFGRRQNKYALANWDLEKTSVFAGRQKRCRETCWIAKCRISSRKILIATSI